MMESTAFFNAKAALHDVALFIDVDPKKEIIKEFFYEGPNAPAYKLELEEIKALTLGKTLEEVSKISRSDLLHITKSKSKSVSVESLGLSLLREAITSFKGEDRFFKEQKDMVCLCFSVTKKDIERFVLSDKDFELKTLVQKTFATSACGSCRMSIEAIIHETRQLHGLVKGLDHSKSRLDADGKWIKIAGLYPGPLLVKLDEMKNTWMKREGISEQYIIEFTSIEGHHLDVSITPSIESKNQGLLTALSDYIKGELGILFFLHLSVN